MNEAALLKGIRADSMAGTLSAVAPLSGTRARASVGSTGKLVGEAELGVRKADPAKVAEEVAAISRLADNPGGPALSTKAPNSVYNQKTANDIAGGTLLGRPLSEPRLPTEMPASINPSATAEDLAIRLLGRKPNEAELAKNALMKGGDCLGCWVGSPDGKTFITYRPAGSAGKDTLPTTATVEINFKRVDKTINDGNPIKLKFPK